MLKFFQNTADLTPRANTASGAAESNPFDALSAAPAPPHQRKPSASSILAGGGGSGTRTPTTSRTPSHLNTTGSPPHSFFGPPTPGAGGDVTPGAPGYMLVAVPLTPGGRATTGEQLIHSIHRNASADPEIEC